ncbi:uncharacterized protein LOC136036768 [Artemia franciscana]|uniref:uncharacterized protein LOC136036768 n=1 Tax=Artemia franciscana TaxID=6661 RepID=UPI0032DAE535
MKKNPLYLDSLINTTLGEDDKEQNELLVDIISCRYVSECSKNVNKSDLRVGHLNCQSLQTANDEISDVVSRYNQFDVLALTETFLTESMDKKMLDITGFSLEVLNRDKLRKGGLAYYVRQGLDYSLIPDFNVRVEGIFESFSLKVKLNHQEILMVLVYYSPSGDTEIFMDELEKLLSKLKCHQYPVIMLGDFNMDLLSLKNNKNLLFLQNCMSYGYLPIVRIPTRVNPMSATLIDNIFVSHQNIVRKFVEVLLFETSDHFATFADVVTDKSKIKSEPNYRLNRRDESEKNIADLVLSFNCIPWEFFFQAHIDSDSAYSVFIDLITSSYNYHCPVLKEPKRKHLPRKPWMTRGLLVSVNNRKTLYKQYLNNPSEEKFHQFKEYRNKLNQLKRNAKEIYFQKSFKNANGNPRKTGK